MTIVFEGKTFDLLPDETLLEGIERQGSSVPSFCRRGICQACVLQALRGAVPAAAQKGLKEGYRRQGFLLACVCRPAEDLEVERCGLSQRFLSRVEHVEPLSQEVLRVFLRVPEGFCYDAGQYVQLERLQDGLMRPFSLASVPGSLALELHVARLPGGSMSGWLPGAVGQSVGIRGPFGDCSYVAAELDRPLLLAGTGTGLAPLLGVVRAALAAGHRGPIRLYHGGLSRAGLYLWAELIQLAERALGLEVVGSVLSEAPPTRQEGDGRCLIVNTALDQLVLGAAVEWGKQRVYLCGHPELVQTLQRKIYLAGASLDRIHSDPFVAPGSVSPQINAGLAAPPPRGGEGAATPAR
ncbi:MAG: 2Fe-2S iron-sulfur cluster binding domain-containing protein [Deltaproteobacteria bacterium]